MKKLILIIVVLSFGLTACQKDFDPIEDPAAGDVELTMDDMKVSGSFDWKTTKEIQLEVAGSGKNVLQIRSLQGDTYLKAMVNDGIYTSSLTIPSYTEEIVLSYNGNTKNVPIVNNKISVNFN